MHFDSPPKSTDATDPDVIERHKAKLRREADALRKARINGTTLSRGPESQPLCRVCGEDGRTIFGRGKCQRCYRRWRRAQGLDKG